MARKARRSAEPMAALRDFNYILTTREVEGGKFTSEPGEPMYLRTPRGRDCAPRDEIDKKRWLLEVRDLADGVADGVWSEFGDVLVFVHGYNNSIAEIRQRQELLQDDLLAEGWKGIVISYDWPCAEETFNYLEDREDAATTAQYLVTDGIKLIVDGQAEKDCKTNIHLLGHSTGAYVIMEAFAAAEKIKKLYRSNGGSRRSRSSAATSPLRASMPPPTGASRCSRASCASPTTRTASTTCSPSPAPSAWAWRRASAASA